MKAAFITGGGRGIGFAVAKGLAADGFAVALLARSKDELNAAKAAIQKELPTAEVLTFTTDISDALSVASAFSETVYAFGQIDVVFNNAGIYVTGSTDLSTDQFSTILDVNLKGAFTVAQHAVAQFRKQKSGHLFNITSVCGVHGFAGVGAYTASKFGLMGLNESLFRELAPEGIKVTAIGPSWVNTAMTAEAPLAQTEMIQPEDLLKTVRYLLSLSAKACPREIIIECLSAPL